ncbi:bifunctional aspartate kinase/homoserine dehydrogenase I [Pseudobacteriovorax antillogorgiicola]|uniref:Aspartate kinase n=1 Tax=Pseudobacteriovorax antillogorgiicola TaxID=1513793 RepID=A0A1Y6CR78_9BACT|nr:bifunctional aspartate kinase/homoserine dehydrogenase I [Pseudobacteriovorax antillogorgiicola]TCS46152.1 aspartate kinase [Pseudobacteriovorax antillogorgiicola]SMF69805.1 aspartate kinase [Pseudobacteriovorax antillogorgiicola]
MAYRVFKFGGSSLADTACISQVAEIIRQDPNRLTVVVSAMGGVTDALDSLAQQAVQGNRSNEKQQLETLRQRHQGVIQELTAPEDKETLAGDVDRVIAELATIFSSVETLGELTAKVHARVVSSGERMMASILASVLRSDKLDAQFLDATELIKLHKELGSLVPNHEKSIQQVQSVLIPRLNQGQTAIIPGFIGESPDGDVMTLGRGGSDYSATLLGSFLKADTVTLYKEVDGLLTADPRYVPNTRVVPELHYREAAELAYYGAKVLHPRAIIPLIPQGIPLIIKNTFKPALSGTLIAGDVSPGAYPVKALTAVSRQAMISVEGNGMMGVPGMAARTFGAMAQEDISVSLITQASSESSICFVVPQKEAQGAREALERAFKYEIEFRLIDEIKIKRDQCVIAIVGLGMSGTHGIAARAFQCIHHKEINVNAIAQGSSELNISVVIEENQMGPALRALHREYRLNRIKALHQRDSGEVNLLIHGFGQIGQTLVRQIEGQKDYFRDKIKIKTPIVSLIDSSACLFNDHGFSSEELSNVLKLKEAGKKINALDGAQSLKFLRKHLEETTYHKGVFVDLTAAETDELIREALHHNLHVVVANKKPLSIPYERYQALFDLAHEKGLFIRYEATVGAGLPVLDTLEKLSEAGDDVYEILGCLSGTLGYLMTQMEDGALFSEAVRIAYEKGYTEPDPRDDLSGMDVARKALILARTLDIRINMEDIQLESLYPEHLSHDDPQIFIESLKEIDDEVCKKIATAKAEGKVLRYVARLSREEVSVGVEAVDAQSPLGRLRGTANQVSIRTRRYNGNPLIVTGPGAGADVTAAGVLNDVIAIAASQERGY